MKINLTVKFFLLMTLMMLAASLITYAAAARFLPPTYSHQLEKEIDEMAAQLAQTIGEYGAIREAENTIALFEAQYDVSVVLLDAYGSVAYPYGEAAEETAVITDDDVQAGGDAAAETVDAQTEGDMMAEDDDMQEEGNDVIEQVVYEEVAASDESQKAAVKKYQVTTKYGLEYTMLVSGGMQQVSQAAEIMREIFPYIMATAVVAALIVSMIASCYLTAPIMELSQISHRMAALDFGGVYKGGRQDEIGELGQNLNKLSATLSRTLQELCMANKKLRSDIELERAAEQKRMEFFSAVSHELKTPITILKGHISGMLQEVGDYKNRDYYLGRSQDTVEQMEEMVKELLTLSRMESGKHERSRTDLAERLRQQIAELTEIAEKKEMAFVIDIPAHLWANVDAAAMEKVFRNLLINAVRYTPAGQGNEIRVFLKQDTEERIFCAIENTGAHIPEDDLPHVFEAFYRVEQSRNRKSGGSGLGLYIVKTALEQHGADYWMENSGQGVRVTFYLPAGNSTKTT